jgi:hypothetical protein
MDTVRDEDENKKWRFMAAQELLNRSEGRPKEVAAVVNEEAEITQEQLNTELRGIAADQLRGMAPDERQRFLAALEGS